jgi:organic hydroperoxide reductase OsmC/OhrA
MAAYYATILWQRGSHPFVDNKYSRAHTWEFDGGLSVPASASPHIVPSPLSVPENVDPEEAFVAALSSCHMLFFLSLAAEHGIVVDRYRDQAEAQMGRNAAGRTAITRVVLRPAAVYGGESAPDRELIEALHQEAHELCFIANSVVSEVATDIVA